MPASNSPYRQVLMSYVTRPGFRWMTIPTFIAWAVWLVTFKASMLHVRHSRWVDALQLPFVAAAALFFLLPMLLLFVYTAFVAAQLRSQLSDAQSYLMPGIRRPILRVAAVAFLLGPLVSFGVMLFTNWVLDIHGVYPPALLAISLTVATPTAWWASWRSPWLALLMPIVFLVLLLFTPFGQFMIDLWTGSMRINSLTALPLSPWTWSVLIIVVNLGFLQLLYLRVMQFTPESLPRSFEIAERSLPGPMPIALIRHKPIFTAVARIWHRRRGVLNPGAPWAVALLLALLLVGFQLLHGATGDDLLRSILLPACIPGAVVSAVWRERLMNLQFESLYPASHRNFINELLGAAALSFAEMWISTLLAVLVPIVIWHQQVAAQVPMLLTTIGASALMQFFVFGVMLIASLRTNAILYANGLTLLAIMMPMAAAIGVRPSLSMHSLIVVAVIEMAVGLLLTLLGTRAWRRADLA